MIGRRTFFGAIGGLGLAAAHGGFAVPESRAAGAKESVKHADTEWFMKARCGAFTHYLTGADMSAEDWNRRVDSFDTESLAKRLHDAGTRYYFITIGQNSGHYCAPNAAYDAVVGLKPSKCSKRDLVADLYDALAPRGIKLFVYLPSGAPAADPVAMKNSSGNGASPATGRYGTRSAPGSGSPSFRPCGRRSSGNGRCAGE